MADHGIRVLTTDVGDRYVLEALRREGGILGAEQSGHVIVLDGHVTGDGLAAALLLCRSLEGRTLAEAAAVMPRFAQAKENVRVARRVVPASVVDEVERLNEELDGSRPRPRATLRHGASRAGSRGGGEAGGGRCALCYGGPSRPTGSRDRVAAARPGGVRVGGPSASGSRRRRRPRDVRDHRIRRAQGVQAAPAARPQAPRVPRVRLGRDRAARG